MCSYHKQCFFPWGAKHKATRSYGKEAPFWARHEVLEHISVNELEPFKDDPTGPATAIARLHTLRLEGKYKQADVIKKEFNIQIYPGGYAALERKW